MSESQACIAQPAADKIKELAPGFSPKIAMILGSGCGDVANAIENPIVIDYKDLPGFPISTVQGHAGQLLLGTLGGVPIAGLKGRVHYYEGNPRAMVVPVYALKLIGCEYVFITNAAGSLRHEMGPGALVALTDHMNFSGANPLIGPNDPIGPRFPSMYNNYDKELRDMLLSIAKASNITLHSGVYVGTSGPSFETAAEINAYRLMGGDTVGMSTVGEVRSQKGLTALDTIISVFFDGADAGSVLDKFRMPSHRLLCIFSALVSPDHVDSWLL